MKSKTGESRVRPDLEAALDPMVAGRPLISEFPQSPDDDLRLISSLIDHEAPRRKAPGLLIRTPGLAW